MVAAALIGALLGALVGTVSSRSGWWSGSSAPTQALAALVRMPAEIHTMPGGLGLPAPVIAPAPTADPGATQVDAVEGAQIALRPAGEQPSAALPAPLPAPPITAPSVAPPAVAAPPAHRPAPAAAPTLVKTTVGTLKAVISTVISTATSTLQKLPLPPLPLPITLHG